MSLGVEFEESEFMKKNKPVSHGGSMTTTLIKNGWAHDQSSANKLLLFLAVLIILAAGIVYYLTIVRPKNVQQVRIPTTVLNRLSPELQAKIKASQK
ncbi:MAG: hypothetical protein RLY57_116 [Candidatus Parcubacteria bacterium]|jgi:hypothetical protein